MGEWQVRWCRRHGTEYLTRGFPPSCLLFSPQHPQLLFRRNTTSTNYNIRIASIFIDLYYQTHLLYFSRCNSRLSSLSPSLCLSPLLRVRIVLQRMSSIPALSLRWDMSARVVQTISTYPLFSSRGTLLTRIKVLAFARSGETS